MRKLLGTAIVVSVIASLTTTANASEDCAKISDDSRRLECFDVTYRKAVETKSESAWEVREEISRIDDSTNVFLTLRSREQIQDRMGRRSHATLHLHCRENTTLMYVIMAGNFLSDIDDYGSVTYRLDEKPVARANMEVSTDNAALGLWSGGRSIPFVKRMFGSSNMLVRITPFNQSSITVDFPVSGLEKAVEPLRKACNW